jgi:peroxiredoxin
MGSLVLRGNRREASVGDSSGLWRCLPGEQVPALRLSFAPGEVLPGSMVSLADLARRRSLAVFFYSGVVSERVGEGGAGVEDARVEGWREHEPELRELGYEVVGVSSQSPEVQAQFALDRMLSFMFLSDSELLLADELELPTRRPPGGERVYESLTMLVRRGGRIWWVFFPLDYPEFDAAIVTERIRRPYA